MWLQVETIPKDVPILLAPSGGRDAFVQLLHDKGFLDKTRNMTWKRDTVRQRRKRLGISVLVTR